MTRKRHIKSQNHDKSQSHDENESHGDSQSYDEFAALFIFQERRWRFIINMETYVALKIVWYIFRLYGSNESIAYKNFFL